MEPANWTELGYPDIDQEHKALFRLLGEIEAVVVEGTGADLRPLIERLTSYSAFHFRSEETAMRVAGFPQLQAHIEEHRRFSSRLDSFRSQVERNNPGPELLQFVRAWFHAHTSSADEKFANFLRSGK